MNSQRILFLLLILFLVIVVTILVISRRSSSNSENSGEKFPDNGKIHFIGSQECDEYEPECQFRLLPSDYIEQCEAGELDGRFVNTEACLKGITGRQDPIMSTYHSHFQFGVGTTGKKRILITGDSVGNPVSQGVVVLPPGDDPTLYPTTNATALPISYLPTPTLPSGSIHLEDGTSGGGIGGYGDGQAIRMMEYGVIGGDPAEEITVDPHYPRYPIAGGAGPQLASIGGSSELLVLMDDGTFYTVGDPNTALFEPDAALTTTFYQPWRQRPEVSLPAGLSACRTVKMLTAANRSSNQSTDTVDILGAPDGISGILSSAGELYFTGPGVETVDPGADIVTFANSAPYGGLTVADFEITPRSVLVLTTTGELYASGRYVWPGAGGAVIGPTFPAPAPTQIDISALPARIVKIAVTADGSARTTAGEVRAIGDFHPTYNVLLEDGTVWSLGQNHFGMLGNNLPYLGQNNTTEWIPLLNFDTGLPIEEVVDMKTTGYMNRYSMGQLIVGATRTLYTWGHNGNSNSPTFPHGGVAGHDTTVYYDMPGAKIPLSINPGDVDGVIAIAPGGHIAPYITAGRICNVGHNVSSGSGSFGDSTIASRDMYECREHPTLSIHNIIGGCVTSCGNILPGTDVYVE